MKKKKKNSPKWKCSDRKEPVIPIYFSVTLLKRVF